MLSREADDLLARRPARSQVCASAGELIRRPHEGIRKPQPYGWILPIFSASLHARGQRRSDLAMARPSDAARCGTWPTQYFERYQFRLADAEATLRQNDGPSPPKAATCNPTNHLAYCRTHAISQEVARRPHHRIPCRMPAGGELIARWHGGILQPDVDGWRPRCFEPPQLRL